MKDDKIVTLRQPGEFADPLTEVLRNGARQLLTQAVEAELTECLAAYDHLTIEDGRQRLVRHGHMPERAIQTGIGPVKVRQPRLRDRGGADGSRIRFSSSILPPYARRTKSLEALLPVLYLRGISSGDMQEALAALLGKDAPNLSPAVLVRLKAGWQKDYERWKKRDLSARRYVYIWADGVYLQARMDRGSRTFIVSDKRSRDSAFSS
jgi:transposase-like protein